MASMNETVMVAIKSASQMAFLGSKDGAEANYMTIHPDDFYLKSK